MPSPADYSSPGLLSLPSQLAGGTGRDSGVMVVAAPVLALHQPSKDLHAGELFSPVELSCVRVGRVQPDKACTQTSGEINILCLGKLRSPPSWELTCILEEGITE